MANRQNYKDFLRNISNLIDNIKIKITSNPLKYTLMFSIMVFFTIILHFMPGNNEYTWTNPDGLKRNESSNTSTDSGFKNQGSYYASIAVFIILCSLYVLKFVPNDYKILAVIASGIVSAFVGLYYVILSLGVNTSKIYTDKNSYILLAVIPFLLLYRSIKRHLTNIDGLTGFIINFILYIPCLLNDLMEYLKGQFAITSNITYVLLAIQVLIIITYLVLPSLVSSPLKGSSFSIMNEANFLDKRRQIDYTIIKDVYNLDATNLTTQSSITTEFNKGKHKFTLSMWVYLNQQDIVSNHSDVFSDVFSYGDSASHPSIKYTGVENGKNKLSIYLSNHCTPLELNIESQKWNNIVFNYNGNLIDVFINGDLVESSNTLRTINITKDDVFNYGTDGNLDGAICNIKYYREPLTKFKIVNIYNLLKGQNPPINNIM